MLRKNPIDVRFVQNAERVLESLKYWINELEQDEYVGKGVINSFIELYTNSSKSLEKEVRSLLTVKPEIAEHLSKKHPEIVKHIPKKAREELGLNYTGSEEPEEIIQKAKKTIRNAERAVFMRKQLNFDIHYLDFMLDERKRRKKPTRIRAPKIRKQCWILK